MVLGIYNVTILYPEKQAFIRTDVTATTNIRAFMKVLKASKWKDVNVDDVLYHTEKISEFPDTK